MLVIRFLRTGKKKQAFYKIVVTDKRNSPVGGRFKEKLGFLNPITKEKSINKERVLYWLGQGAQTSDTVHNLLVKEEIIKAKKRAVQKKSKKKEDAKPVEAPKAEVKPVEEKKEEPKKEETKPEEKKKEDAKPAETEKNK